jgi:hypothetical protein
VKLPPETTLAHAKAALRARLRKGARCPLCTQHAKVYRRTVTASMARELVFLVRLHDKRGGWVHGSDVIGAIAGVPGKAIRGATSGDFSKLELFGLTEAKPNTDDPAKRESGYWRPTDLARQFVRGEVTVAKYAEIYDGELLRLDASQRITIRDALGKRFDYAELMATVATTAPDLDGGGAP